MALNNNFGSSRFGADALLDFSAQPNQARGFHAGPLAGMSAQERRELANKEAKETAADESLEAKVRESVIGVMQDDAFDMAPVTSLADLLAIDGYDALADFASDYVKDDETYNQIYKRELPEDEAIQVVAQAISERHDLFDQFCRYLRESEIDFFEAHASQGVVSWPDDTYPEKYPTRQLLPYLWLFHHEATFTFVIPAEVRSLFAGVDFDSLRAGNKKEAEAARIFANCVLAYGIIPVEDAMKEYRRCANGSLSNEELQQVITRETNYSDGEFGTCEQDGIEYLVAPTLSDQDVYDRAMGGISDEDFMASAFKGVDLEGINLSDLDNVDADEETIKRVAKRVSERMNQIASGESTFMDDYVQKHAEKARSNLKKIKEEREVLLNVQAKLTRRELPVEVMRGDLADWCLNTREAAQLEDYLNWHIPNDAKNDRYFAETVVESICFAVLMDGCTDPEVVTDILYGKGMSGCDGGTGLPKELVRLAKNYHASLPLWDCNGWSVIDMRARERGYISLFDEHGLELKPGRNDTCPCGSGKKYKRCHGMRPRF